MWVQIPFMRIEMQCRKTQLRHLWQFRRWVKRRRRLGYPPSSSGMEAGHPDIVFCFWKPEKWQQWGWSLRLFKQPFVVPQPLYLTLFPDLPSSHHVTMKFSVIDYSNLGIGSEPFWSGGWACMPASAIRGTPLKGLCVCGPIRSPAGGSGWLAFSGGKGAHQYCEASALILPRLKINWNTF